MGKKNAPASDPVPVELTSPLLASEALEAWQLAAIDEGIAAADAGCVVSHEDIVIWVDSWNGVNEHRVPECG